MIKKQVLISSFKFCFYPKAVFCLAFRAVVGHKFNSFKETKNVMSIKNNYYSDKRWLLKNWEG